MRRNVVGIYIFKTMFFNLYLSFLEHHVSCSADHTSVFIRFLLHMNLENIPLNMCILVCYEFIRYLYLFSFLFKDLMMNMNGHYPLVLPKISILSKNRCKLYHVECHP